MRVETQQDNNWHVLPRTGEGWGALALAVAFLLSAVINSLDVDLEFGGLAAFLLAIAAGALALYAIARRGERSLLVLLPVLPALFVIALELAELFAPPY